MGEWSSSRSVVDAEVESPIGQGRREVSPPVPTFELVFAEEYVAMVRLATLVLTDERDAEEIVQDAFARLHERWSTVVRPGAYLRRSVLNACTDRLRRRRVIERFRPVPEVATLDADHVLDVVRMLPPKLRAVVVLRFYEDRSELEIAQILQVPPGTVKSRLHRALARLGEVIER